MFLKCPRCQLHEQTIADLQRQLREAQMMWRAYRDLATLYAGFQDLNVELHCKLREAKGDAEAAEALVERCKLALRESASMLRVAANDAQTRRQDDDAKAFRKAAESAHRISIMTPAEAQEEKR